MATTESSPTYGGGPVSESWPDVLVWRDDLEKVNPIMGRAPNGDPPEPVGAPGAAIGGSDPTPRSGRRAHERFRRRRRSLHRPRPDESADEQSSSRWGSSPEPAASSTAGPTAQARVSTPTSASPVRSMSSPSKPPQPTAADVALRPRVRAKGRRPSTPTAVPEVLVDPRIARRRAEVQEARNRAYRRSSLVMLLLAVSAILATTLAISPLGGVQRIEIVGASHSGNDRVRSAAKVRIGQPIVLLRGGPIRQRLERLPWVARASVRRGFNGRQPVVRIRLVERVPAATVRVLDGRWLTVDATGRVLERTPGPGVGLPRVIVRRIGPTPVGARILAARIGPILTLASPLSAIKADPSSLDALSRSLAETRPDGPRVRFQGGITHVAPGLMVPVDARRGLLVARGLPPEASSRVVAVQVDLERVRVLVGSGRGVAPAGDAEVVSAFDKAVAFDFGAVDLSGGRPSDRRDADGEAAAVRDVQRRQRALAILLKELDLSTARVIDLSVPDAPVVTRG